MDVQLLACQSLCANQWSLTPSGSGALYLWGHNHRGQLGGIEGQKVWYTSPISTFSDFLFPNETVNRQAISETESSNLQSLEVIWDPCVSVCIWIRWIFTSGHVNSLLDGQVTKPTFCESIAALQPTEVAAGEQTIFIISDGKVYSAGKTMSDTRTLFIWSCRYRKIIVNLTPTIQTMVEC